VTTSAADRRFRLACVAALLLFLAAYANSLTNAFHFDDAHVIENNLFIRDLANVPRFFTDANTFSSTPANTTYRPVVSLTLAIDYAIGRGLNPVAFHVTQLLLFAAVGALVFLLYRRIAESTLFAGSTRIAPRWFALFAATLYCVHTGNTQPANYISARSELLSALGVLGAFALYIHAPRSRRFHLYLLPAAVGVLAKNHAVMFAPLLLTYKLIIEQELSLGEILTRRHCPDRGRALRSSIPAFVVLVALFVMVELMPMDAQSYGSGSRWLYLATSTWVWVRYVGLYFLPIGLTADTDITIFTRFDPRILAGLALLAASLAAAWIASRSKEGRPVAFGILWFWIAIAPTSTIVVLAEVTNDHRYFIGFIGLNLAVLWTLALAISRSTSPLTRFLPHVAVALLIAHSIGTHFRNRVWRNDETLWADVARKSPKNGRGLMNYGLALMKRGRLTEARDLFVRAQQYTPFYSYLEVNLGIVNAALGDHAEAERRFRRGLELDGSVPVTHRHFARWLLDRGRGLEALPHIQALTVISPADIDAKRQLMALYAALGETEALQRVARATYAVADWDAAARAYSEGRFPFAPASADAKGWFDLGWSFTQQSRHLDAAQAYRAAVAADPQYADAWNNLGWTLGTLGFASDAVPALERALALRPSYVLARSNLAWVRGEIQQGRGVRRK
jgi:tetratricopeptide (TPR) repeat protein